MVQGQTSALDAHQGNWKKTLEMAMASNLPFRFLDNLGRLVYCIFPYLGSSLTYAAAVALDHSTDPLFPSEGPPGTIAEPFTRYDTNALP